MCFNRSMVKSRNHSAGQVRGLQLQDTIVIKVINVEGHSTVLALLELHPETPVSGEVSVPSESLHDEDRTQNPEEA